MVGFASMVGVGLVVGVGSVVGIGSMVQWWVCGSMVAVGGLVVASVFGCCGGRHRGKKEEREE